MIASRFTIIELRSFCFIGSSSKKEGELVLKTESLPNAAIKSMGKFANINFIWS